MTMTLADAVVRFGGDLSPLEKGLGRARTRVQGFTGFATKALGGAVLGGAALAAGAVLGIGAAAFNASAQTNKATADIAASLGIAKEEAEDFGRVARDVWANNFADSIGQAGEAVAMVRKQLGLAADDPALQRATENAFRLADAYDADVADSISTVRTLTERFGISSDRAFNLVAAGYQRGLDRSGDFLDTINEYSTQFAEAGASAEEMFGLMDSGLQGGMLGTDKAADAFKEFRVRIQDGSDLTAESLEAIGLNVDYIMQGMRDGSFTASDAFNMVTRRLRRTDDSTVRFQAGVGLLGTQFEDLGDSIASGLELNEDWAEGTEGAIDRVDAKYDTIGQAVEGFRRRFITAFTPVTDKLLELVNEHMPDIESAFTYLEETIVPAIMEKMEEWATWLVEDLPTAIADLKQDWADLKDDWQAKSETVLEWLGRIKAFLDGDLDTALSDSELDVEAWAETWFGFLDELERRINQIGEILAPIIRFLTRGARGQIEHVERRAREMGVGGPTVDNGIVVNPENVNRGSSGAGGVSSRSLSVNAPLVGSVTVQNEADEERLVQRIMQELENLWDVSGQAGVRFPVGTTLTP